MSNPQLVDYVKRQFQIGVDEASIRSALLGSGWPEEDVDEGMAEVKGVQANTSSSSGASEGSPRLTVKTQPQTEEQNFQPQEVRSVDLRASAASQVVEKKTGIFKRLFRYAIPALGGLAVAGALVWGFISMSKANDLQKKIDTMGGEATALQYQLSEITTKSSDLQARVNSLTTENEDLTSQVGLFVVPKGATSSPAKAATLKGIVSGGGSEPYYLKLSSGVALYVKNYKLPEVDALLKEFSSKAVEAKGLHVPGSFEFTLEAIDGKAPQKASPATSTTTTSTSPASGV